MKQQEAIDGFLAMAARMTATVGRASNVPKGQTGIFVPLPEGQVEAASEQTRREGYAHWVIGPEYPRFKK